MRQTTQQGPAPGMKTTDLSAAQQRLLGLMREIQFGRIESLAVTGGDPDFSAGPTVIREIKFGAGDGVEVRPNGRDFALKAQAVEMFQHLRRMRDGVVEVLEIRNGLPFRMSVRETLGA